MEKTIKQKVILLLCAVIAACMAIGCAAAFSHKANAQEVTETYITFNEANAQASNYVYYDADGNGSMKNEVYIYTDGRFNPTNTRDAALWWTAPASGSVTIQEKTISLSIAADKIASVDGVRWALLKVGTDGKCTALTNDFWNTLKCSSDSAEVSGKYNETANYGGKNVQIVKDEKIVIVIDCGGNKNNSLDQPAVTASMKFTPTDGTETEYAFQTSYLSAHASALTDSTEYAMGLETTNYYSWGASTFTEKQTLTADANTSTFTQTSVMDGKEEANLVFMTGTKGQWNINGVKGTYHVAIGGGVAKIHAPTNSHDTQLVWKAPEDGVFSLDSLTLEMKDTKDDNISDGMKYAILYKNSEGKYYDLYTENEIADDAPWHNLEWKAEATTINNLSDFAMQSGDEFIVMFNRKGSNTLDPCTFNINISFSGESGFNTYTIEQSSAEFTTQGTNNFYFRDVYTPAKVVYKKADGTELYTDNIKQGDTGYTFIQESTANLGLNANERFVGWRNGSDLYKAGDLMGNGSITRTNYTVTAVIITLAMQDDGAGLRISTDISDAGLRFKSDYDLSAIKDNCTAFGTIVAVTENITAETLVLDSSDATIKIGNIPAVYYITNADGSYTQQAVVPYTADETDNYAKEVTARGYVTVKYKDNSTATFYTGLSASRSVAHVANQLYSWFNSTFSSAPEYDQLKAVVDAFKAQYVES